MIIGTLKRRVGMRRDLEKQGWESLSNVLDATEQLQRQLASESQDQGQLAQLQAELHTAEQQKADTLSHFVNDNAEALETAENKRDQVAQDLVKASANLLYTRITAPISGTVQELAVSTIGQVVSPGEQLMVIVPDRSALDVVALVQNQDVGFLRLGQVAIVKVDAFPFTQYGTIEGYVANVSHDSVDAQDAERLTGSTVPSSEASIKATPQTQNLVFPVRVALAKANLLVDGQLIPLSAGMSTTVEVRTGSRTIMEYLLSPLLETTSAAGHER
jgi:hemolysin D